MTSELVSGRVVEYRTKEEIVAKFSKGDRVEIRRGVHVGKTGEVTSRGYGRVSVKVDGMPVSFSLAESSVRPVASK